MSRYIDRGTFEELLVVNPAEAERALDVIRPLLDEFRTVVPAADLYFIVSHDRQTFADRFEYADVGVERDGVLFLIRRTNSPSKGYTLFFDRSGFAHSDHSTVDRAGEGLRQPKHIGRLSARKVDEWLSYLTAHYRNLERLDAENARSIASFRERVEALPDVVWNYRQSGGTIERRGLSYTFEIDRTGYVEKIELHGSLHRLDEFLMLSTSIPRPNVHRCLRPDLRDDGRPVPPVRGRQLSRDCRACEYTPAERCVTGCFLRAGPITYPILYSR
jgi:hypothetical protein